MFNSTHVLQINRRFRPRKLIREKKMGIAVIYVDKSNKLMKDTLTKFGKLGFCTHHSPSVTFWHTFSKELYVACGNSYFGYRGLALEVWIYFIKKKKSFVHFRPFPTAWTPSTNQTTEHVVELSGYRNGCVLSHDDIIAKFSQLYTNAPEISHLTKEWRFTVA